MKEENPSNDHGLFGLTSEWPLTMGLTGSNPPCRLEGEIADAVVHGAIPEAIDGTFYRVMIDPFVVPDPRSVPIDGDGSVSAFRFRNGRVDVKLKYVETERYKLERKAKKALFGLYRNPFTHHPCVRAAVDSTANTNLVFWAGYLLALKESALPYAMDPDSLETIQYDPFAEKENSSSFSAHPKLDPTTDELICWGYEAKGLATLDLVSYGLDRNAKKTYERWLKTPWCGFIHDGAITKNWLVLMIWPFEASLDRMKAGGPHWAWNYERPATFLVIPRSDKIRTRFGWAESESRSYPWKNCMPIHTAGAWEDDDGMIYMDSTRVHDNAFPFFPTEDGQKPAPSAKADFVRWEIDASQPTGTQLQDPEILLDQPCEFPRVDERFWTKQYRWVFLNCFISADGDHQKNVFHGLNGLAMHDAWSGKTTYFHPGRDSICQEPIFIPRSADAAEADGWVMCLVERKQAVRCDIIVIDTRDFTQPVAIVQLPLHIKSQVHGNWVPASALGTRKSLVKSP